MLPTLVIPCLLPLLSLAPTPCPPLTKSGVHTACPLLCYPLSYPPLDTPWVLGTHFCPSTPTPTAAPAPTPTPLLLLFHLPHHAYFTATTALALLPCGGLCVAASYVTARLGPGPNEGSAMVIARSFATKPRVFCLVSPRIMFLETGYELVEFMRCPQVRAQQRSEIYGDVVHRTTSGLIRAYKMGRAREE
jgi:hypothetical protein